MAAHTAVKAQHATLSGTTQDVVTISGAAQAIQVINRHATLGLWFSFGDTDPGALSAAADDTYFLGAGQSLTLRAGGRPTVVRLLGDGAGGNAFTVQAVSRP